MRICWSWPSELLSHELLQLQRRPPGDLQPAVRGSAGADQVPVRRPGREAGAGADHHREEALPGPDGEGPAGGPQHRLPEPDPHEDPPARPGGRLDPGTQRGRVGQPAGRGRERCGMSRGESSAAPGRSCGAPGRSSDKDRGSRGGKKVYSSETKT